MIATGLQSEPHHTTPPELSQPQHKHRAQQRKHQFNISLTSKPISTNNLRHLKTVTWSYACQSADRNRHADPPPYATNLSALDKIFAIPHDVSRTFSLTYFVCEREKIDSIPVTDSLWFTCTANHMQSRHTASRTQSCGIMSSVECTFHVGQVTYTKLFNCHYILRHQKQHQIMGESMHTCENKIRVNSVLYFLKNSCLTHGCTFTKFVFNSLLYVQTSQ